MEIFILTLYQQVRQICQYRYAAALIGMLKYLLNECKYKNRTFINNWTTSIFILIEIYRFILLNQSWLRYLVQLFVTLSVTDEHLHNDGMFDMTILLIYHHLLFFIFSHTLCLTCNLFILYSISIFYLQHSDIIISV